MLMVLLAIVALPALISIARGKPAANIVGLAALALGAPVIGWFVGLWLALDD